MDNKLVEAGLWVSVVRILVEHHCSEMGRIKKRILHEALDRLEVAIDPGMPGVHGRIDDAKVRGMLGDMLHMVVRGGGK